MFGWLMFLFCSCTFFRGCQMLVFARNSFNNLFQPPGMLMCFLFWQFSNSYTQYIDLSNKNTPKGAVGFAGKILLFWMPYSTDLGNDSLFLMSWGRRRSCALDEKEGTMWSKWRQLKQFELGIELLSWSINFNQLFMSIITVIIPLRIYKRIKNITDGLEAYHIGKYLVSSIFPPVFFVVRFADHYTLQMVV